LKALVIVSTIRVYFVGANLVFALMMDQWQIASGIASGIAAPQCGNYDDALVAAVLTHDI
jgi:hypothetical protein